MSNVLMQKATDYLCGAGVFLAGVAVGVLGGRRAARTELPGAAKVEFGKATAPPPGDAPVVEELRRAIGNIENRLAAQEATGATRFAQMETRLDEHAAKLAEMPSTSQIVAAMEQLLSRTMASLDDRLSTQAHMIEVLKATVSQTDGLLERVLESLDSLQTEAPDPGEGPLLSRTG